MAKVFINPPISKEDQAMDRRMVLIVRNAIERAQIKGAPVALYDAERKCPYLLYPNGAKVYSSDDVKENAE